MAEDVATIGPHGSTEGYLRECWRHRQIVAFLARRDFLVRYRGAALGLAWVLAKPALSMVVFTLVFGRIARLPSDGVPYPLLVLVGMLPWQFLASVATESSISIANNPNLVTKVYFPRILLPASTLALNAVDLAVHVLLLGVVMAWFGIMPPPRVALAPLALALAIVPTLGAALWLSALMVRYRDLRNALPVALQFLVLATPVAYSSSAAPEQWRSLLGLNPLCGAIDLLRWCVLPSAAAPGASEVAISAIGGVVLVLTGYAYFRHAERRFADVL